MKKLSLALLFLGASASAFPGPMINGGQINPATSVTLTSATLTQASATQYGADISSGIRVQQGTALFAGPAQFTYSGANNYGIITSTGMKVGVGVQAAWFNGTHYGTWAGNSISLTSQVTGTLPTANGGSGVASPTAHGVLIGEGASAFMPVTMGSAYLLVGAGASADPTAVLPTCGTSLSCTLSAGTYSWDAIQDIRTSASPTFNGLTLTNALTVPNGGTGQQTLTNHGVLVGQGTSAIHQLAAMANGQLAIGAGTGSDPSVAALTAGTGISITNGAGSITIANTAAGSSYFASTGTAIHHIYALTASATIYYQPNMTYAYCYLWGGGGGGGGGTGTCAGGTAGGGGGGSGDFVPFIIAVSTNLVATISTGAVGGTLNVAGSSASASILWQGNGGPMIAQARGGRGGNGAQTSAPGAGGPGGAGGGQGATGTTSTLGGAYGQSGSGTFGGATDANSIYDLLVNGLFSSQQLTAGGGSSCVAGGNGGCGVQWGGKVCSAISDAVNHTAAAGTANTGEGGAGGGAGNTGGAGASGGMICDIPY